MAKSSPATFQIGQYTARLVTENDIPKLPAGGGFQMNGISARLRTDQDDSPYTMTIPASGHVSNGATDAFSHFGVAAAPATVKKTAPAISSAPKQAIKGATPEEIDATVQKLARTAFGQDAFSIPSTRRGPELVMRRGGHKPVDTTTLRPKARFAVQTAPKAVPVTTAEWMAEGQRLGYVRKSWPQRFSDAVLKPARSILGGLRENISAARDAVHSFGGGFMKKAAAMAIGAGFIVTGLMFGKNHEASPPEKPMQNISEQGSTEKSAAAPVSEKSRLFMGANTNLLKNQANKTFGILEKDEEEEDNSILLLSSPKEKNIFSDQLIPAPDQAMPKMQSPFSPSEILEPYPG